MDNLFARPIALFNLNGKEKVSTKCSFTASIIVWLLVLYSIFLSSFQVFSYNRMKIAEKIGYGETAKVEIPFTEMAKNLAFRAYTSVKIDSPETERRWETNNVDPTIA